MTRLVDQTIPSGREEPRLGLRRYAAFRPGPQCGEERIAQRIFGECDITAPRGEEGEEAAVGVACHRLDGAFGPHDFATGE